MKLLSNLRLKLTSISGLSKKTKLFIILFAALISFSCNQSNGVESKDIIKVFHHDRPPSMETLKTVKEFFNENNYNDKYNIKYFDIKDDNNNELLSSLGLPKDHFPFAIAINGKTSAEINGEHIVFVKLPDFMHHIGRRKGNWTLDYLKLVLEDKSLLLNDNPTITTEAIPH